MKGELYVGYLDRAPRPVGRFVRRVVVGLLVLFAGMAVLLVALQGPFSSAVFELGRTRELAGVVREIPYPELILEAEAGAVAPSLLLTVFGKRGADEASGLDGRRVSVAGTLFYRDEVAALEILPGGIDAGNPSAPAQVPAPVEDLGTMTLEGEIVDSKCWIGTMKPGAGKVHRGCAARCISGGVPPMLIVDDGDGDRLALLLLAADGGPLDSELLGLVGEPVRVAGRVERRGSRLFLRADPATAYSRR